MHCDFRAVTAATVLNRTLHDDLEFLHAIQVGCKREDINELAFEFTHALHCGDTIAMSCISHTYARIATIAKICCESERIDSDFASEVISLARGLYEHLEEVSSEISKFACYN